jgi:tRNA modification GTPase
VGAKIDLDGVPVHISDTAGLRDTKDLVEAEGVRRAQARAEKADLILLLSPILEPEFDFPLPPGAEMLRVVTKADLGMAPLGVLSVSATTGFGMQALRVKLAGIAARLTDFAGTAALARPRQIACMRDAAAALERALDVEEPELRGEELRAAASALARLTGVIGVEAILDAVFSGFCIGK